jgi:hypothetical protein
MIEQMKMAKMIIGHLCLPLEEKNELNPIINDCSLSVSQARDYDCAKTRLWGVGLRGGSGS